MVDGLGRLIRVDEPNSGGSLGSTASPNQATSYTYDARNNLTQVSQGAQTRTFNYSSLSRLTSAANPESGTTTYAYDNNSNLTSKTDARSVTTTITYDELNRPVSKSYSGISTAAVNYYYDNQTLPAGAPSYSRGSAKGRLVAVTYGGGSEGNYFGYDELGRVNIKYQRTGTTNYQISASYNKAGGMTGETYPSTRTVSYSYDNAGRLTSFSGTLGDSTSRTYATIGQYNAAGLRERESYGTGANGMTTPLYLKLHYNRRQQMVDLRLGSVNDEWNYDRGALIFYYGSGAVTNWNPFQDDTDNNGNVRRQVNYVPKPGGGGDVIPQLDDYTYDSLNRIGSLTQWQLDASGNWQSNVVTQSFSYDRYGNRCVASATGGVSSYCPTYTASTNRISGLTYDAAGNITYDALTGGTMTYDAENRLLTASSGGGASYTYDGEGKRVKRVAGGQTWWYVYGIGGELLAEYLSTAPTTVKKEYGYRGGQMLVVWDADKSGDERLKWLVQDHLGSTRMEADKSGSLSAMKRHDYAPFGEEMAAGIRQSGGVGQYGYEPPQTNVRQKFTGYERDNETGLDFAQARYLSNLQGRFTSPDPLLSSGKQEEPQSWNRYSYVGNRPTIVIDPTGLAWGYFTGNAGAWYKWFDDPADIEKNGGTIVSENGGAGSHIYKATDGRWIRLERDRQEWTPYETEMQAFYGQHEIPTALGDLGNSLSLFTGAIGIANGLRSIGSLATGLFQSSSDDLVHLTTAEAAKQIAKEGVLKGNIYAGPASNASASGWGVTLRTGLNPGNYEAIAIPSSSLQAFSKVVPTGPFTAWQRLMGTQYTARGVLDLSTGAFTRTGINWNQVGWHAADATVVAGAGFTIHQTVKK